MTAEFSGIERRLDELSERLARLRPLADKARAEFDGDLYLRDIVLGHFAELIRAWLRQQSATKGQELT